MIGMNDYEEAVPNGGDESGLEYTDAEDAMYLDKSPEYWAGWTLAYYQWESGKSFAEILSNVTLSELLDMYEVYHQMDISKSVEYLDSNFSNPTVSVK